MSYVDLSCCWSWGIEMEVLHICKSFYEHCKWDAHTTHSVLLSASLSPHKLCRSLFTQQPNLASLHVTLCLCARPYSLLSLFILSPSVDIRGDSGAKPRLTLHRWWAYLTRASSNLCDWASSRPHNPNHSHIYDNLPHIMKFALMLMMLVWGY